MKTLVTLAILRDLVRREAQVCCDETQRDEGSYTEGGISWRCKDEGTACLHTHLQTACARGSAA